MFDIQSCSIDELPSFRGAIDDMLGDGLDGLIVRGAFPAGVAARAVDRLAGPDEDLVRCEVPVRDLIYRAREDDVLRANPPYLVCRDLISSPLDQVDYFDSARRFRRGCRRLFDGGPDFQERVEAVLAVLGGGRPVDVPRGPAGQPYAHATVRIWPTGHAIGTHCGLEILTVPGFAPLQDMIDVSGQLSYFSLLQAPASGGVLALHDVRVADLDDQRRVLGVPMELVAALRPSTPIHLDPGDLLVFDGGRIFHRVGEIGPGPNRVTIGGFVALDRGRQRVMYWS